MGPSAAFAECPSDSPDTLLDFCFNDQVISLPSSMPIPPVLVNVNFPIVADAPNVFGPNTVAPSLANLSYISMKQVHLPTGTAVPSLNNLMSLGPNASVTGGASGRLTLGTLTPPHGGTVGFGADAGLLSDGELLDADAGAVTSGLPPALPTFGVGFDGSYNTEVQAGLGAFGDEVVIRSSGNISMRAPVSLATLPGIYFFPFNAVPNSNGGPQSIYIPIPNGDLSALDQIIQNSSGGILSTSPTLGGAGSSVQDLIAGLFQPNGPATGGPGPLQSLAGLALGGGLGGTVPAAVLQSLSGPVPFVGLTGPDSSGDMTLGVFVPGHPGDGSTDPDDLPPGIGVNVDIDDFMVSGRNEWSVSAGGNDLFSGWDYFGGPLNENIFVPPGGRLSGQGVIAGSTIVAPGGVVAPGIHVGVLAADSFLFQPGSVLEIDIDAGANTADAVIAATSIVIQPGVTLDLNVKNPSQLGAQRQFVIASAPSVTLQQPLFVKDVPAGYDLVAGVTPNNSLLLLQFMRQVFFTNFLNLDDLTPNQLQVAQVLNNLQLQNGTNQVDNPLVDMVSALPEDQQASALDELSGEGLVNIPEAAMADSSSTLGILSSRFGLVHDGGFLVGSRGGNTAERTFAEISSDIRPFGATRDLTSVADKIFGTFGGAPLLAAASSISKDIRGPAGYGAWIEGYAVKGDLEARDLSSADTDYSVYGVSAGADHVFDIGLLLGAAFSYSHSKSEVNTRLTEVDGNTYRASIYGGKALGDGYIAGAMSYAQTQFDSQRAIAFASSAAEADFDGTEFTAYIEGGYAFNPIGDLIWEPVASARASNFEFDGYTEDGAGSANLTVASRSVESIELSVGQRFRHPVDMRGGVKIVPELRTFYNLETKDLDRSVAASLEGATFLVTGAEAPSSTATVGVGLNAHFNDKTRFSFDYDAELASRLTEHTLALRFRWAF